MTPDDVPDGMRARSFAGIFRAPYVLGAFAVIVFAFSRTMLVSPGKLDLEVAALTLVAVAAYCACAFGRRFADGDARVEERDHALGRLKQVVIVLGLTLVAAFLMFGIADARHSWAPPAQQAVRDQPNASHFVVFLCALYVAILIGALLRWTDTHQAPARRVVVIVMLACIAAMIGRAALLAPQLPPFHFEASP